MHGLSYTLGFPDSLKYDKAFQSLLWTSHPQISILSDLVSFFFAPLLTSTSGSYDIEDS
jgi:hypothetical protein